MNDGVMKYAAGASLGLAGASDFIAGIVKMCSDKRPDAYFGEESD